MSAGRSGWERPAVVCEITDLIADIHKRLDLIEAEDKRRAAARDAAKALHSTE